MVTEWAETHRDLLIMKVCALPEIIRVNKAYQKFLAEFLKSQSLEWCCQFKQIRVLNTFLFYQQTENYYQN